MGVFIDEPKYPVIDKAPGFWKTVGNFNRNDYLWLAGYSAVAFPFGYVTGRSAKMAIPSAWAALSIGALGGFMMAYSHSSGRLMGMFSNDGEVETGLANKR
ncbi:hypothetical protein WJX73_007442 [Symbiochloris irregularis]|uniref:NADH-ubiquinone oxidoreductase 21kDa subunit N-terminal domain-containing protein n=1 Tax=Symbiochloris irregularis TaxID=706552 RepID=A0AAW1PBD0_9CHLO